MDLPLSSFAFLAPITAALILVRKKEGASAVRELLKRPFDHDRIRQKIWLVPNILIMPAVVAVSGAVMALLGLEAKGTSSSFLAIPVLFVVFFIAGIGEEVGWTGCSLDPLLARWSALTAATVLGSVWAMLHHIPWIQVHGVTWTVGYSCLRSRRGSSWSGST